jgi:hypothetical protein
VNDIDVTLPSNSLLATIYIVWIDTLAITPSPAPTIISPLGNNPKQFTPYENSFLTGANLL